MCSCAYILYVYLDTLHMCTSVYVCVLVHTYVYLGTLHMCTSVYICVLVYTYVC